MFGFSLPKIVVLVVIIALVWYGFKVFSRGRNLENPGKGDEVTDNKGEQPVDMEACTVCGDYVATGSPSCGTEDCPFPAA